MQEPALGTTLALALDLAWTVEPPELQTELLEAIAEAALSAGSPSITREVLLDLQDPLGRAWLHARLADHGDGLGETAEEQLRHLRLARDGLGSPKRWRARPEWMGQDIARARLVAGFARLGAVEEAALLLPQIAEGRLPRALALIELCRAAFVRGGVAVEPWICALAAADRVADPDDARTAHRELARVAIEAGLPDRALGLARMALPLGLAGLLLAEEVGALLCAAGLPTAALSLWESVVLCPASTSLSGTEALCRLLEARLLHGDEPGAVASFDSLVRRVALDPLPPEPQSPYPWRPLYLLAIRRRPFAPALRDALRRQDVVPPAWCFALGKLEIDTGQTERARRAAVALEASAVGGIPEPESLVYGALLRAAVGDLPAATRAMYETLGAWPAPLVVDLPGQGPEPVERLFTRALLLAGAEAEAVDLVRTVGLPLLRAELLCTVAQRRLDRGQAEGAGELFREAEASLDEARHRGEVASAAALGGRIAAGLRSAGDASQAVMTLHRVLVALGPLRDDLALPALATMLPALREAPDLEAEVDRAALSRAQAAADPAARGHLLLGWVRARGGAVDHE